jgi:glycosyltransferase involved in cell wall biosynthesis
MHSPTLSDLPLPPKGKIGWPWTEETVLESDIILNAESWPKITIVTPSYNQGIYIEETIRSVLLQGYPNLEYIVMDGGSTDETLSILKKYEAFLTWVSEKDGGQADAIASGFERASGSILAWINSDDRYLPNAFLRIAEVFRTNETFVFVHGDVRVIDEHSHYLYTNYAVKPNRFLSVNTALGKWPQPGCFWQKDAYHRAGGVDRDFQFCMDLDLFVRLMRCGEAKTIYGKAIADFRLHQDSKTSNWRDVEKREKQQIIEKYGSRFYSKLYPLLLVGWVIWIGPRIIDVTRQKIAERRLK